MRVGRLGSPELIALAGSLLLAMVGLALVLYVGVIARPGQPAGAVSLGAGWYLAALGCILECAGGAVRAGSTERPRKPPGVL
jgi:hypothetical protein